MNNLVALGVMWPTKVSFACSNRYGKFAFNENFHAPLVAHTVSSEAARKVLRLCDFACR